MARTQRFSFGRLSNVDIRLLRVFATIVQSGGFSEAQAELDMAPSTISTCMSDLEQRLGVRLCSRGRSGFRLTDKGRVVHGETQKLFAAFDQFGSAVASLRGEVVGELRIGLIDNSVLDPSTRIPGTIFHFTERHPDVHVFVEVLSPDEIEAEILDGRLDIGIGVFRRKRPGITYIDGFSEMLDLYCGKEHRLFARAPDGLSQEDLTDADYAKGTYLPSLPPDAPAFLVQPSATAHQAEGLAFLIQSGRYVGYLPRRYAAIWVERGHMRPLLPGTLSRRSTFHIVTRKGVQPTMVLRAFLEELGGRAATAQA